MNSILISIIVPSYNCAKYIKRCIESIENQGLYNDSYEVIVIDDGSTDGSREEIARIIQNNPRVFLLEQKRQGPGIARERGIKESKGKYILFLDSDDYLEPFSLQEIIAKADENKAEMVFYNYKEIYEKGSILYEFNDKWCDCVMTGNCFIAVHKFFHSVCRGIYARKFIENSGVCFENQVWGEDVWFIVRLLLKAKRVIAINKLCYNYIKYNFSSLTNKKNTNRTHLQQVARSRVDVSVKIKKIANTVAINTAIDRQCVEILENAANVFSYYAIYKLLQSKINIKEFSNIIHEMHKNGLYPVKSYEYKNKTFKDEIIRVFINLKPLLFLLRILRLS